MIKFICNGNILWEFFEARLLTEIIKPINFFRFESGSKITIEDINYEVDKVIIEYTTNMHGDYGTAFNLIGEDDDFNTVIIIELKQAIIK